jgi:hypothetical protein
VSCSIDTRRDEDTTSDRWRVLMLVLDSDGTMMNDVRSGLVRQLCRLKVGT